MAEDDLIQYETEIKRLNSIISSQQTSNNVEQQQQMQQQDSGMVREQLDLTETYELIDHLLEGEVLVKDESGNRVWQKPTDETMILFSEEGKNYLRRRMSWHINKITLLSNYDEYTIRLLVKDFSFSVQDALFMKSRQFFQQPSLQKCMNVFEERLKAKIDIKLFTRKILGINSDEKEVREQLLKEMEGRVEEELEIIRETLIKNREKEFESAIIDIEYLVLSTYNRALGGEERGSIRRHQQSLEVKGGAGGGAAEPVKPGLLQMFKK